jgi:CheY-like chemotaxis protein
MRERCLAAGMDGFVVKPVRRSTLFAAIAEAFAEGGKADDPPAAEEPPDASLRGMFASRTRDDLVAIRQALDRADRCAVGRLAHGVAGAACVVGAREIARHALELERLAPSGEQAEILALVSALAASLEAF